jgi:hypothetical protein
MSQPRQQRQQGEQPFTSNIQPIPQEEQHNLNEDGLDLNLDLENPDTSGYTTSPDETQSTVSSFESQGSLHLSDLQGGAKKKTATKKKATKKKTAKKKTATKKKATKKTEEKKSTGFFGLFKGGKDKEKKIQSSQFIAPMERLL